MFQTVRLECHQPRSFTLKMHQNRWWLGLCPRPLLWELTAIPLVSSGTLNPTIPYSNPPDPLAGLRRPISKGRGRKGRGGTMDPDNVGDRLMLLDRSTYEQCNLVQL